MIEIETLRFPIGEFITPASISPVQIQNWIDEIETLPSQLKDTVQNFTTEHWNTTYRPQGWTLLQVVHHLADSHMNSYIRFKLALTEDTPIIRPYYEDRWAECIDASSGAAEISLNLLESLHKRWVLILRSLTPQDLEKGFVHPEHGRKLLLKEVIGLYAWHGKHHLNHLTQTIRLNGW